MIEQITFRKSGGSLRTTLPKASADRLHHGPGDMAYGVEMENGILLPPDAPVRARDGDGGADQREVFERPA